MTRPMIANREFFEAAATGDAERVSELVRSRPELVHATQGYDKTGLHLAAEKDYPDVARVLLDAGANIEARTSWGATALDWAATMGSTRVGQLLLDRGAKHYSLIIAAGLGRLDDVKAMAAGDLSGHRRQTVPATAAGASDEWPLDSAHVKGDVLSDALYAAARNGHTEAVEYLLGLGADVNARGFFGAPGLHWAAINGYADTVELLLSRGADRTIRDARFDGTAENWAHQGGHRDIVARLRRKL